MVPRSVVGTYPSPIFSFKVFILIGLGLYFGPPPARQTHPPDSWLSFSGSWLILLSWMKLLCQLEVVLSVGDG
jgi:hypothetical protein